MATGDSQSGGPVVALVTGAAGFVGHHLVDLLLRETDWQIVGLARGVSGQADQPDPVGQHEPRYRVRLGDICAQDEIRQALAESQPDYVVHLAATTPPAPEARMYGVNVGGTANLLEAVSETSPQARVLVVGSDAQYGRVPPRHVPTSEQAPMRPVGAYGRSKVLQERIALQYRRMTGLDVVCVRPFNHIGPGQSDRFVVSSLARQIARAEAGLASATIQLGRTDTARDFTDVRDVVRAYLGCLRDGEAGTVYNIGSGRSFSIGEIAERLAATAAVPVSFTSVAARARPGDVLRTQCDASRVSQCIGWAPRISIEHTLRDTLDYWRGQVNGPHRPGGMESAAGDPR